MILFAALVVLVLIIIVILVIFLVLELPRMILMVILLVLVLEVLRMMLMVILVSLLTDDWSAHPEIRHVTPHTLHKCTRHNQHCELHICHRTSYIMYCTHGT